MQNYDTPIKGRNFEDLYDNYRAKCRRIAILERYIKRHLINSIDKADDFYLFSSVCGEKTLIESYNKTESPGSLSIDRREIDRIDIIVDYDSLNRSEKSIQVLDFYQPVPASTQTYVNLDHVEIQTSIDLKNSSSQTTQQSLSSNTQTELSSFHTSSKQTQRSIKTCTQATNTRSKIFSTINFPLLDIQPLAIDIPKTISIEKRYRTDYEPDLDLEANLLKEDRHSLIMQVRCLRATLKFLREENNLLLQQISKTEFSTIDLEETLQSFRDQNEIMKEKNAKLKNKVNHYRSRYAQIYNLSMKLKDLEEMVTCENKIS
jgi:hypothetical protein